MALKSPQQSLKNWTKQKWRTKSGKPSAKTGERYLPEAAIKSLSPQEYAATTRAKRAGKDGDFIMKDGMYIYVRANVVAGPAAHSIFTETTRKAPNASSAIADALNG